MKALIKLFTGLGALIILFVGISLLAVTIYGFVNSSLFLGDASTRNIVLGIMLAVSLGIIGGAGEGIYGICKERPKLICVFQIIVIIFMLIFFAGGIGLVYITDNFFNGTCSNSTNAVINYASNIYDTSIKSYCEYGATPCPCALDINSPSFATTYTPQQQGIIADAYPNLDPVGGSHTTIDCIKSSLNTQQIALFTTIGDIQNLLKCSAWCPGTDPNLIYRFADINTGKPEDFCYPRVVNFFDNFSYYGKLAFFIGGGVLLLMFMCNMYLCCCNEQRRRSGRNMRDRFMFIVETDGDDRYYRR